MTYDLVIRNGNITDGTGAPARSGDIAVQDGKIAAVGEVLGDAKREIDATGLAVTPGFVPFRAALVGSCWITWSS